MSSIRYFWVQLRRIFYSVLYCNSKIVSNKIIFDNFNGKGFGDNPRYIAERLAEIGTYDIVWLVKDDNIELPGYIRKVENNTKAAFYEFSTAKIWVDNVRNTIRPFKRKGQIYLQTWHGSFALKRVEGEASNTLAKEYIRYAKNDGKNCDYILADSLVSEQLYREHFWLNSNTKVLQFGLPRNDILFKSEQYADISKRIKQNFKIPKEDKLILYAPTFRDDLSIDGYKIDFAQVANALQERVGINCVILIKLHPNVSEMSGFVSYNNNIIDVSKYPNIQELAIASDILITDYSSSYYDFLILRKPVFLCALDRDQYERQRGLVEEYNMLPFPYASSTEELVECIKGFDCREYQENITSYIKRRPIYDKGNASIQVAKFIKSIIDLK